MTEIKEIVLEIVPCLNKSEEAKKHLQEMGFTLIPGAESEIGFSVSARPTLLQQALEIYTAAEELEKGEVPKFIQGLQGKSLPIPQALKHLVSQIIFPVAPVYY